MSNHVGHHTPGPWAQWRQNNGITIAPELCEFDVALVYDIGVGGDEHEGEDEANARLIAAAPALLAALALHHRPDGHEHGCRYYNTPRAVRRGEAISDAGCSLACRRGRAALAAANGLEKGR